MVHIAESSHNWSKEMLDMKCGGGVLCDRFCIFILQTEWWPSNKPKSHMDMLAKVYTLLCHKLFGLLSGVMQWVASMLFWIRRYLSFEATRCNDLCRKTRVPSQCWWGVPKGAIKTEGSFLFICSPWFGKMSPNSLPHSSDWREMEDRSSANSAENRIEFGKDGG